MNRKPLNQPKKEPKPETPLLKFKMFKNGFLNTNTPRRWNWCLGYNTDDRVFLRTSYTPTMSYPDSKVNGKFNSR